MYAGGGQNVPSLFSYGYFSMKKGFFSQCFEVIQKVWALCAPQHSSYIQKLNNLKCFAPPNMQFSNNYGQVYRLYFLINQSQSLCSFYLLIPFDLTFLCHVFTEAISSTYRRSIVSVVVSKLRCSLFQLSYKRISRYFYHKSKYL